jgi:WD40 repeat protein
MMRTVIVAVIGLVAVMCLTSAATAPADLVQTIDAHFQAVTALGITPDGTALFTGSKDGRVKMWDVATYEMLLDVPACQVAINDLAVSPDGTYVVTVAEDGYAKVWDALTAELLVAIPAHKGAANCVAISPDSLFFYTGGEDGYVRTWSVEEDYAQTQEYFAHYYGVNDIIVNASGGYVFSCGGDGYVKVFNTSTALEESAILAFDKGEALCLRLNNLEACLATGGSNGEIRVFDASTGSLAKTIRAHAGKVRHLAFLEDDSMLVSGGEDGKIKLWNRDGELAGEMQAHVLGVRDFLLGAGTLITAGADYKVRIWTANF